MACRHGGGGDACARCCITPQAQIAIGTAAPARQPPPQPAPTNPPLGPLAQVRGTPIGAGNRRWRLREGSRRCRSAGQGPGRPTLLPSGPGAAPLSQPFRTRADEAAGRAGSAPYRGAAPQMPPLPTATPHPLPGQEPGPPQHGSLSEGPGAAGGGGARRERGGRSAAGRRRWRRGGRQAAWCFGGEHGGPACALPCVCMRQRSPGRSCCCAPPPAGAHHQPGQEPQLHQLWHQVRLAPCRRTLRRPRPANRCGALRSALPVPAHARAASAGHGRCLPPGAWPDLSMRCCRCCLQPAD